MLEGRGRLEPAEGAGLLEKYSDLDVGKVESLSWLIKPPLNCFPEDLSQPRVADNWTSTPCGYHSVVELGFTDCFSAGLALGSLPEGGRGVTSLSGADGDEPPQQVQQVVTRRREDVPGVGGLFKDSQSSPWTLFLAALSSSRSLVICLSVGLSVCWLVCLLVGLSVGWSV